MTTNAVSAKGIKVGVYAKLGSDATEQIYYFNEVKAVPEIGHSPDKIEVTHLTSDIKEFIPDIPDFSSDLSFTMNCQPYQRTPTHVSDSNLNLLRALSMSETYKWIIIYPQNRIKVELYGKMVWSMGAGAVSSAMEANLVIIPSSAPVWSELYSTYTVTYDANTGTGTMTDTNSPYSAGSTVSTKASTFTPPEGKIWASWNTLANGQGVSYDDSDTFVITEDTTLYAQWTEGQEAEEQQGE